MTAAAPVPSEGRRPLGEVLVDRGIVTPEQLTTALEQQRSTGKQLGEIIVALGFAPGPIVAQALATQHGGMIKTEYGFAMGWSSDDAPALVAPPVQVDPAELAKRDTTIAELRAWAEQAQTAIDSRDDAIARLQAALAEQRAAPVPAADDSAHEEALAALESELKAQRDLTDTFRAELEAKARELQEAGVRRAAELAERDEALAAVRTELETERARPSAPPAAVEKHAAEISRLETAIAELEQAAALHEAKAARALEAQATSEHELTTVRRTVADLERRLENARSRADTLARRITEQDEELEALRAPASDEPTRWASATTHYVLRRGSAGYDLVAHDGPPPAVGDTVDGLRVARIGPAGPGLDVPCAYLAD